MEKTATCVILLCVCISLLIGILYSNINTIMMSSMSSMYQKDRFLSTLRPDCPDEDVYLVPNDAVLQNMSEEDLLEVYWNYINSQQAICHKRTRFGSSSDGGKEVCLDTAYRPKHPCLVYSFGSNFEFSFEETIHDKLKCEIHTFDPSQPIGDRNLPSILNFHLIGLGGSDSINSLGWKMRTLSSIMNSLNHTDKPIDVLKIDIEGGEWDSLPQILESNVLRNVKQVCLEAHFGRNIHGNKEPDGKLPLWGGVPVIVQIKTLRQLYNQGFRIFHHEYVEWSRMTFRQPYGTITNQNEISLVNIYWKRIHDCNV